MTKIFMELTELLKSERDTLLVGDFEKLADISDKKQFLRDNLAKKLNDLAEDELLKLKDQSLLNDRLLKASLDGLGAVKDRLKLINDAQNRLTTYGGNGKICHAETRINSVERRA